MAGSRRVANDPLRRERIIHAALGDIVENGVHRTSHRSIARRAEVPLGSLTYYFDDLASILEAAFTHLADTASARYRDALDAALMPDEAIEAIVDLICGDAYFGEREFVALFEFYSYGSFNDAVRHLRGVWTKASRDTLQQHFNAPTAQALDALVEGWTLHRAFEGGQVDRRIVVSAVHAVIDRLSAETD